MYYYDRTYKVPVWVIVEGLSKRRTQLIMDSFAETTALNLPWPSKTFKETLEGFKNKGWAHAFQPDHTGGYVLDTQLLNIAFLEHLKLYNPATMLSGNVTKPVHHLNRVIKNDDDIERLFNEFLSTFEPKIMSFAFNIGDLCHMGNNPRKVFVSEGPVPQSILSALADNLITVKSEGGDVNLKGAKDEEVFQLIAERINQSL